MVSTKAVYQCHDRANKLLSHLTAAMFLVAISTCQTTSAARWRHQAWMLTRIIPYHSYIIFLINIMCIIYLHQFRFIRYLYHSLLYFYLLHYVVISYIIFCISQFIFFPLIAPLFFPFLPWNLDAAVRRCCHYHTPREAQPPIYHYHSQALALGWIYSADTCRNCTDDVWQMCLVAQKTVGWAAC